MTFTIRQWLAAVLGIATLVALWLIDQRHEGPYELPTLVLMGTLLSLTIGGLSSLLFDRFAIGAVITGVGIIVAIVMQRLGLPDGVNAYSFILAGLWGVSLVCARSNWFPNHPKLRRLVTIAGWSAKGGAVIGGAAAVMSWIALRTTPQNFNDQMGFGVLVLFIGNVLCGIAGMLVGAIVGLVKTRRSPV